MDCMWKWFVFLLFIAGLPYVFIYISTSESIELSSRDRLDIRDRKSILPKEQSLDEIVHRKEEVDRNKKTNKKVWIRSPSKTKDENYFQSLARKFDSKVGDKKMARKESQDSLNYTIESSLINSDANIHRKEKHYTIFETESKIMKSISVRYHARNADIRDGNHFQGKKKLESFSKRKSQENAAYENQTKTCQVAFDKDSLKDARQTLYRLEKKSFYLFYFHLEIENVNEFSKNRKNVDNLLNWQYVLKDQKFLLQLPVDFDLVTFNLLYHTHEEQFIKLKAFYNNINCTQDSIETIKSTKDLLWKELFNNDTRYYLCNRHYLSETGREALYHITTIWVGYDLTCSEAPTEINKNDYTDVEKDKFPLIIPIITFLLSLQFVWIFVLVDFNSNCLKCSKDDNHHKYKSFFPYQKGDRPYGIKRFLMKLFHANTKCCELDDSNAENNIYSCVKKFFSAQRRLICLMWIFILFPFGLVRTLSRYDLNKGIYKEYAHVVRTSEPMFNRIPIEKAAVASDVIYALVFPMSFILIGTCYYNSYSSKYFQLFSFESLCTKTGNETNGTNEFTGLSNRFVSRCDIICSLCESSVECKSRCLRIIDTFIHIILCFFPIFSFFSYFKRCKCLQSSDDNKVTKIKKCVIFGHYLLCFVLIYFVCLRPIISTFTFLLRFGSYFVFVLLPIRISIFRYTFIVVSAIVYLVKYLHELINMNSAILDYIFEKVNVKEDDTKPKLPSSDTLVTDENKTNPETLDEEIFTWTYKKLLFVRKKLYFFVSKTVIVLAYLIVTIGTFLSNKDSLTSTSFKDIVEIVLVFIGPYAISLFFKGGSKDFLTDDNKNEIDTAYEQYISSQKNTTPKTHKENGNDEKESTGNQLRDNQNRNTPTQSIGAQPTNNPSNSDSPRVSVHVHSESKESTSIQYDERTLLIEKNKSRVV